MKGVSGTSKGSFLVALLGFTHLPNWSQFMGMCYNLSDRVPSNAHRNDLNSSSL